MTIMFKTYIGKLNKNYETKTYDILKHMLSLLPHSLIFSYSQTSKLHWNDIENELLSQRNGFRNFNFDVSLQHKNNPYIFLPVVHYTKLYFLNAADIIILIDSSSYIIHVMESKHCFVYIKRFNLTRIICISNSIIIMI